MLGPVGAHAPRAPAWIMNINNNLSFRHRCARTSPNRVTSSCFRHRLFAPKRMQTLFPSYPLPRCLGRALRDTLSVVLSRATSCTISSPENLPLAGTRNRIPCSSGESTLSLPWHDLRMRLLTSHLSTVRCGQWSGMGTSRLPEIHVEARRFGGGGRVTSLSHLM